MKLVRGRRQADGSVRAILGVAVQRLEGVIHREPVAARSGRQADDTVHAAALGAFKIFGLVRLLLLFFECKPLLLLIRFNRRALSSYWTGRASTVRILLYHGPKTDLG